jgi:hypothetical protein
MKRIIFILVLIASLGSASAQEAEPSSVVSDYLDTHSMDTFDSKRLKTVGTEFGIEVGSEIYAQWIAAKGFQDTCSHLVGSCDYYLCREKISPCGVKGYYLAFGYQYCQKSFTTLSPTVSEKGQKWLKDVATCLQQSMDNEIPSGVECGQIKSQAIKSHTACYDQTNFCGQKFTDVLKVLRMLAPEIPKPQMIAVGLTIIKNCVI